MLKLIKFLFVGGAGALCYFLGSCLLTYLGVTPWIASVLMYIFLIPNVYLAQKKIVFKSKNSHHVDFPKYIFLQLVGAFFSAVIPFFIFSDEQSPQIAFIIVVIFVAFFNFFFQRNWIFKPK
jgi:putative flippase GtrA